jgi:hypothetical protein
MLGVKGVLGFRMKAASLAIQTHTNAITKEPAM